MLKINEVKSLIEPHFYKYLKKNTYKRNTIYANNLLTWNRFDIAFKIMYIEGEQYGVDFYTEMYRDHIRAFSLDSFKEPGNKEKNSIEKYLTSFNDTFSNIKNNNFDCSKTVIPLSINNSIADGSHRVASSIFLNRTISCINIEINDQIYDYKFFYGRNVPVESLDIAATKFVEYSPNAYIALIWPSAVGRDEEIGDIISNIIYEKKVRLSINGAKNFLSQVYANEPWIGSAENDFIGTHGKIDKCFENLDPLRVIAFHENRLEEVLEIKNKIRKLFKLGKHSIHITDNKEEAIRIARIIFNKNNIHFLNYAKPNRYLSTYKKIDRFKRFIKKNNLEENELVLDGGIILSMYGLREANDIDILLIDNDKVGFYDKEIEFHDKELEFHNEDKLKLIINPEFYFYFNDLKFISFYQLYKMKKNRGEEKDVNDMKIMETLIEDRKIKLIFLRAKQILYFKKIKFISKYKNKIINILKIFGLYWHTKKIYRILKGKKLIL